MSGAARVNEKIKAPSIAKYEAPSTMRINVKKHPGMKNAQVKQKISFKGHGIVKGVHADEYGHTVEMDVHHISADDNDD